MLLFNIVKNFAEKLEKILVDKIEEPKVVLDVPIVKEEIKVLDNTEKVAEPIRIKNSLEISLNRLKTIYLNTKKFRIKKKLNKRISKLQNEKLVQVRQM